MTPPARYRRRVLAAHSPREAKLERFSCRSSFPNNFSLRWRIAFEGVSWLATSGDCTGRASPPEFETSCHTRVSGGPRGLPSYRTLRCVAVILHTRLTAISRHHSSVLGPFRGRGVGPLGVESDLRGGALCGCG